MAQISDIIFRAYDIRGIVDKDLTEEGTYLIGRAIGSEVIAEGQHQLYVARDGRLSGDRLIEKLKQGLFDSGCNIVDIGMTTTPVMYFACKQDPAINSGVILTASHNPAEYNGIKIVINGKTIFGDQITALADRIKQKNFSSGVGKLETCPDMISRYINDICGRLQLKKPLKIVIDCANGVAGLIAPKLFNQFGCDVTGLYTEVDGRFPNHGPDPSQAKNLQDMIKTVKEQGADIGLAFDGDADRVYTVTHTGDIIFPDRMLMLIAADVLKNNPGASVLYDVKSSKRVAEVVEKYQGNPIMSRTGHAFIKQNMLDTGALLAGEMSGHVFIADNWYGFDDGIYTAARLLSIISQHEKNYSDLLAAFPDSVSTEELSIPVKEEEKSQIMKKVMGLDFGDASLITLDGLRVEFKNGWGLIRQSNTSPNLIMRFEADDEKSLSHIQALFREKLTSIQPGWQLPF